LIPLLPNRLTSRFKAGERPLPGVDWELVEMLGAGGFGEVWKARNPHLSSAAPVALKFCLDRAAKDRLLLHEAAVLDRVMVQGKHRGIVQLRHTYLSADPPCLEYEYVAGGDLAALIKQFHRAAPGVPWRQAAQVVLHLARAVGFAHRLNPPIVHRDLKPANVLVQKEEKGVVLRVADFGIGGVAAGQAIEQTRRGTTHGELLVSSLRGSCTPLYASPQQMQGQRPDPRDDVYSLGVIWYQVLTGDLGRGAPSGKGWRKQLAEAGMPVPWIDLLEECIEYDPAERPADAGALAQRIEELTRQMPGVTGPPAPKLDNTKPAAGLGPGKVAEIPKPEEPPKRPKPAVGADWRQLWQEANTDSAWVAHTKEVDAQRTKVRGEVADFLGRYLGGQVGTEELRATFDRRTRTDWEGFGFKGLSGGMFLNKLVKYLGDGPKLAAALRSVLRLPKDEEEGRTRLRAFLNFLGDEIKAGHVEKGQVQPARVPFFISCWWHIQDAERWPIFYPADREVLEREGLFTPTQDPVQYYFAFRQCYLALASSLGLTSWQLGHLCYWQAARNATGPKPKTGTDTVTTEGPVDDDEETAPADRDYWEKRAKKKTLQIADGLLPLINEVEPGAVLRYTRSAIGIEAGGSPRFYLWLFPQKSGVLMKVKAPQSGEADKQLGDAGIDWEYRRGRIYRFRITGPPDDKQRGALLHLIREAKEANKT
jgi:serine/threonine protein kinase